MIDKSKTYRTRDGREVRIYATDGHDPYPIHGAIKNKNGWWQTNWGSNGGLTDMHNSCDLIEVRLRIKRTVWLNVYEDGVSRGFLMREWADAHADKDRLACVRVEIDCAEGEGL